MMYLSLVELAVLFLLWWGWSRLSSRTAEWIFTQAWRTRVEWANSTHCRELALRWLRAAKIIWIAQVSGLIGVVLTLIGMVLRINAGERLNWVPYVILLFCAGASEISDIAGIVCQKVAKRYLNVAEGLDRIASITRENHYKNLIKGDTHD